MGKILVVGSLAYDSISTPAGKAEDTLGGSANYFGLSASLFAPVSVVGVVGEDYKDTDMDLLRNHGVDISGIQRVQGKTFRWAGQYSGDMNEAQTLKTDLNVFADFHPAIPEKFKDSDFLFLANIDPVLQMDVLNQVKKPKIIAADTMNFWIHSKLADLKKLLTKIDILLINEGEAKMLSGASNAVAAAKKIMGMGPKSVVIKRGEYGFLLFMENQYFILPAFPISEVVDPTGAGDTFAGGFMGYLAKTDSPLNFDQVKRAAVYGTLMASHTVQDFGVKPLKNLTLAEVEKRHREYLSVIALDRSL